VRHKLVKDIIQAYEQFHANGMSAKPGAKENPSP